MVPAMPRYFLISLNPPPLWLQANTQTWENFVTEYSGSDPTRMEINYLQEGSVVAYRKDGSLSCPPKSLWIFLHSGSLKVVSPNPVMQEAYISFRLTDTPKIISTEEAANWRFEAHYALLPEQVTDPVVCEKVATLLKAAAKILNSGGFVASSLRVRAYLYEMLAILTEYAMLTARQNLASAPPESRYTKRAVWYIRDHIAERFSVADVAAAVGISYSHLKAVFLKEMGMSLVEYANRERIRRAEHMISVEGRSQEEASAAVGFQDPKYMGRLFRRYTGMTCLECRRLSRQDKTYRT